MTVAESQYDVASGLPAFTEVDGLDTFGKPSASAYAPEFTPPTLLTPPLIGFAALTWMKPS